MTYSITGWIVMPRAQLSWQHANDVNITYIFNQLLLRATYVRRRIKGRVVERGQLFVSVRDLAKNLPLTWKQIRNIIKKLVASGDISIVGHNDGTLITINKYEELQGVSSKNKEGHTRPRSDHPSKAAETATPTNQCTKLSTNTDTQRAHEKNHTYIYNKQKKETVSRFRDIRDCLSERAYDKCKRIARDLNWDWYYLCERYNAYYNNRNDWPKSPDFAFSAWIMAFTKGKAL